MLNAWVERGAELREEFERADPIPLLVIDDFLDADTADGLVAEFPAPDGVAPLGGYSVVPIFLLIGMGILVLTHRFARRWIARMRERLVTASRRLR